MMLQTPLSADESVWAYIAKKLLSGKILYKDVATNTPPTLLLYLLGEQLNRLGIGSLRALGLI